MSDTTENVDRGDDFTPTPDTQNVEQKDTVAEIAADDVKTDATPDAKSDEVDTKAEAKSDDEERQRDDKGRYIPKDRFDEAVRKERSEKEALAARLKEFEEKEAQRTVAADFEQANKQIKEMIKQHTSLLADGELDKASDLMEKILGMQAEITERKAEAKAMSAKNQAKEEVRYDALVAKLEADYPQINPDSADFDQATIRNVQALMNGLIQAERLSPSAALKEAVETLLGAAKKAEDTTSKQKAEDLGMRRKEEAVKKALDAKTKQPASTKDVGMDHDKQGGALDASAIMKMTQEEFARLPDSKLSEMRGDFVA